MSGRTVILLLLAAIAIFTLMEIEGTHDADRAALMALYVRDAPLLESLAKFFTYLGNWWTVVGMTLAVAIWMFATGRIRNAVLLLVSTFAGRVIVILSKAYFARLRPEEDLRLVDVHYQSFPSGHAANSMTVYLAIAVLAFAGNRYRKIAIAAALTLSLLIGISRPMLGVHWPSDVIGGWTFGAAWLLLILAVADRLWPDGQTLKRNSKTSPS